MHYDVFNGDADGILALLQLRKASQLQKTAPQASTLVTGVKRDIQLLNQVAQQTDVSSVTVLDISMDKNKNALEALIKRDIPIFYCDHHRTGEVPVADNFTALINTDANTCTSLLINQHLGERYVAWAIAAAYGDNMVAAADALCEKHGIAADQQAFLNELGVLINYNGYGASVDDLLFAPADLYHALMAYESPIALQVDRTSPYYRLQGGYAEDMAKAQAVAPEHTSTESTIYCLPNAAWARRISGVFGNQLANQAPDKANAVLTLNPNEQDYTVSVRAPLSQRHGADEVCGQFPTGGGRKAAAGINQLPKSELTPFIDTLNQYYRKQ
ncbi:hypothetical protein [Salinivibrio sp. KP-1]|uniref:hypothetical protein n=1 Tax=Salinivibrio sp. KP-1 TaxID=1406902 RepID=UPI0006144C18|nr:hypothetical protein [Salinivibrio sp. KP-1]KKA44101.1 acetyltransferase [Salinivibrio sp. KP-1]